MQMERSEAATDRRLWSQVVVDAGGGYENDENDASGNQAFSKQSTYSAQSTFSRYSMPLYSSGTSNIVLTYEIGTFV